MIYMKYLSLSFRIIFPLDCHMPAASKLIICALAMRFSDKDNG